MMYVMKWQKRLTTVKRFYDYQHRVGSPRSPKRCSIHFSLNVVCTNLFKFPGINMACESHRQVFHLMITINKNKSRQIARLSPVVFSFRGQNFLEVPKFTIALSLNLLERLYMYSLCENEIFKNIFLAHFYCTLHNLSIKRSIERG